MTTIDEFYPLSYSMQRMEDGEGVERVIAQHLERLAEEADRGNRLAEVELCKQLGMVRRSVPEIWEQNSRSYKRLRETIHEVCGVLENLGRQTNLRCSDPRMWITTRDGEPRWE